MNPYYEDAATGIVIYHGDAFDVLPTLQPGSVDLVLTDPPYGLDFRGAAWDAEIPDWLPAARRIAPTVIFTTAVTTAWRYPRPDWALCYAAPGSTSRAVGGGFNHWWPVLMYGRRKFPTDLIILPRVANLAERGNLHPSPKPIRLFRWLVQHGSDDGQTILDPFMGSGTTLRAAKDLGRRAMGIEREERWCEAAARRLSQGVLPLAI